MATTTPGGVEELQLQRGDHPLHLQQATERVLELLVSERVEVTGGHHVLSADDLEEQ
jgi:hypothetical protein